MYQAAVRRATAFRWSWSLRPVSCRCFCPQRHTRQKSSSKYASPDICIYETLTYLDLETCNNLNKKLFLIMKALIPAVCSTATVWVIRESSEQLLQDEVLLVPWPAAVELLRLNGHLGYVTSVWVEWTYKATLAPRPFSDILCVTVYSIPPVVPYIWQSTVSYITKSSSLSIGSIKRLLKLRNLNSAKSTHEGCVRLFLLSCGTSHI
jgi:hypothetical protein